MSYDWRYIYNSAIADNVGLSEKTVRTRINQLNDWLVEQGLGRIERKAGNGNMAGTGRGPENAAVRTAATSDDFPASIGFDNRNNSCRKITEAEARGDHDAAAIGG